MAELDPRQEMALDNDNDLNPLYVGRQTRSGTNYSPWAKHFGSPIRVDFDIAPLAQDAAKKEEEAFAAGKEDVDSLPIRRSSGPSLRSHSTSIPGVTAASRGGPKRDGARAALFGNGAPDRDKMRYKARRRSKRDAQDGDAQDINAGRRTKRVAESRRADAELIPIDVKITGTAPRKRRKKSTAPPKKSAASPMFATNPVTAEAFVARRLDKKPEDTYEVTMADAIKLGFSRITWDGRKPHALVDKAGRVFAMLAGSPKDTVGWAEVNADVQALFDKVRVSHEFKDTSHRRGEYATLTAGISYGGGQTHPGNLAQTSPPHEVADELLANTSIRRLAGFGDAAFKLYSPRLYEHYASTMNTLLESDDSLETNFEKVVFAAATFNLGPQVATYVHTDHQNLPAGWCAITAIGDFDPTKGGHLLLWDLKLMIEFPPGALILIPSAILRHSNATVGSAEHRYSFTQYSAGGLFRWVECGCQSLGDFKDAGGTYSMAGSERWLRGVGMWSTWEELRMSEI